MSAQTYIDKQLHPLEGGSIVSAEAAQGEEGEWYPSFTVRCKDGKVRCIWVLMDEEGNGPGAVEIVKVSF